MIHANNHRGFTLIEMTVGLLIAAVLTLGLFRIFKTTSASFNRGTESIDGQQNARAALSWIARELRGAKGFTLAHGDEVTFLSDANVSNQIRTFRLDDDDRDGDGDVTELLLVRNPDDDGTPGVYMDEIAVGIDSLAFVYRDGSGTVTTSRAAVQEVEVQVFARGHRLGRESGEARHEAHESGMATRVRCRNLGKSVPTGGDALAPDAPTGLAVSMGCGTATASWTANSEDDLAGYYLAYDRNSGGSPYGGTDADQGPSPIFVGSATTYTLTGLDLDATYFFNLRAVDAADNVGMWGTEVQGIPADVHAPEAPTNLVARVVENDEIYLGWTPSPDWDVAYYRVDWTGDDDPTALHSDQTQSAHLNLTGLDADVTYTYKVTAVDGCGNESDPTAPITITLVPCDQDVTFPDIPEGVAASAGDGFVRLTWNRVPDTDVVGYQLYFEDPSSNGSTLLVGNVNTFTIHGLENGDRYELQVAAMDGCGHVGGFSGLIGATPVACGDNAPPAAPQNVTATDEGLGDSVTLSWTRSSESDVMGYLAHWGTTPGGYTTSLDVGDTVFRTVTGLTGGAPAYFAVSAYDACGNEGALSTEASATPTWGCVCPPVVATETPSDYAVVEGTVPWTVTAAACSTTTIQRVEFRIDGAVRHVDYAAPYEFGDFGLGWNTMYDDDGPHMLVAAASDDNGCLTTDTTNVFVDNSASGLACLGIEEGTTAQLVGPYDEGFSIDVANFSNVDTYRLDSVVLDWTGSNLALTGVLFDSAPAWTAVSFPGAPGDTLPISGGLDVPPGGVVNMEVNFWDNPPSAVPDVSLETAGIQVTFLGSPLASCGPYAVTIMAPPCDPGVSIVNRTSTNAYDVFGVPSVGDQYYTDRSYVFTALPDELAGSILVRTPNNDKNGGGSFSLTLHFDSAATVYIAYDPRGTPPNWITNNYTDTGLTIGVTDSGTSTLGLWVRDLPAGNQVFKGNKAQGWSGGVGTNYIIFALCQEIGI